MKRRREHVRQRRQPVQRSCVRREHGVSGDLIEDPCGQKEQTKGAWCEPCLDRWRRDDLVGSGGHNKSFGSYCKSIGRLLKC